MNFLKQINDIANTIQGLFGGLVMILCIGLILGLAVLLIVKRFNKPIAVIIQTLGSCILMVPIMFGLNNLVESKVGSTEQTLNDRNRLREQERKINELEGVIRQIESTGFNLQQFERILELGLVETQLTQTTLHKRVFDRNSGLFGLGAFDWEYLGVMTSNVTAKFGVDLKTVRFYNSSNDPNTIMVYGIESKFIGTSNFSSSVEVSEVRRVNTNGETQIDKSTEAIRTLRQQEREMDANYRDRLNKGLETAFMNDTVEKLAENFVKLILAPLNKEIIFTDADNITSLPLNEFLVAERELRSNELNSLINQPVIQY
jgi:hypothetical protein